MAHKQRVDIHQEIKQALKAKERFGESKYEAKRAGTAKDGIYSYSTAKIYNRECQRFAEYVKEVSPHGRYTSLEDARAYLSDYIERENSNSSKSAYTVKLERSALAKLYGIDAKEIGHVDDRHRADITRSRQRTVISEKTGKEIKNESTRAGHFSEKNRLGLAEFAKSSGLRRCEVEAIRGNQFYERDGKAYLHLDGKQCKGGRTREVELIGNVETVKRLCMEAKDGLVFDKSTKERTVSKAMDVHHYRSVYASEMYKSLARNVEDIPKSDRYICRKDLKGAVYDKQAMMKVSENLGHSRISVIAEHYLR